MIRPKLRRSRPIAADSPPVGAAPGTLATHVPETPPTVRVFAYSEATLNEVSCASLADALSALPDPATDDVVRWIDIVGRLDAGALSAISTKLDLHPLTVEAVSLGAGRAEASSRNAGSVVRFEGVRRVGEDTDFERLAVLLRPGLVVSFQERAGDAFEPIRERLRAATGKLRSRGAAYLAYALLDATVDAYFPVIDALEARLEAIEDALEADGTAHAADSLYALRTDVSRLRRYAWPLYEATRALLREDEHPAFDDVARVHLRDCLGHLAHALERIDALRDSCVGLLELNLALVSHRMNEVISLLTLVSTIFIPLGFLAGVWGMNFRSMPETQHEYGYFYALGAMVLIAAGLLGFFRRRGWLGGGPRRS